MNKTKIYAPLNIQRFASGTIYFSVYTGSYNVTFQGKIVWSSVSNGSSANTSTVYCDLYAQKQKSSSATTGKSWSGNITIDGTPSAFSSLPSSVSVGNSWTYLYSFSKVVAHNPNGARSIVISGSIKGPSGTGLSNATSSGSQQVDLDTIPRYFSNTPSLQLASKTETSITYNWYTSETCSNVNIYLNGSLYTSFSPLTTSGTFTISNLSAGNSYSVYGGFTRSDSGLVSNSNTMYDSTYSYPYSTNANNFTIGKDNINISLFNPMSRSCKIYIILPNDEILGEYETNGSSISITTNEEEINKLYNSIPNSPSGNYKVKTIYETSEIIKDGAIFTINYEDSKPTFSNFEYKDVNPKTLSLTNNENIIIDGYSTIGVSIKNDNKATGYKGSTIKNYNINGTNYEYSDDFYQEVEKYDNPTIKIFAIDSRDNSTSVEKPISLIGYEEITKGEFGYERSDEGVGTQVTFAFQGKFWNNNFGNVANEINANYKFKKTKEPEYGEEKVIDSSFISIDDNSNYSFSGILSGDNESDNGFDIESSYDVKIIVSDKLSKVEYNYTIIEGSPAVDLYGNCISLGSKYDESRGGRVQLPLDMFYPIGSIYITLNNDNPSIYFGGEWEKIKGRFLLGTGVPDGNTDNFFGAMSGTTYNAGLGTLGGQDYHTLTIDEIPSHTHKLPGVRKWVENGTVPFPMAGAENHSLEDQPTGSAGGNQYHNNMPPYLAVNMWKRIG